MLLPYYRRNQTLDADCMHMRKARVQKKIRILSHKKQANRDLHVQIEVEKENASEAPWSRAKIVPVHFWAWACPGYL